MQRDDLRVLIQSMSKTEKRQFSIRHAGTKKALLFKAIDTNSAFQDPQLHNLRGQLYKHLLSSLRTSSVNQSILAQLTQEIEGVSILTDKGLISSAYRLLQKVKKNAVYYHQITIQFQVLQLERELSLLTLPDIDLTILQKESSAIAQALQSIQHWSSVLLLLTGWFMRNGHALNSQEIKIVESLIDDTVSPVGFYAVLYALQAKVYCAFICDHTNYPDLKQLWIDHFEDAPQMKMAEPLDYEKAKTFGIHKPLRPDTFLRDTTESVEQYYVYGKFLFDSGKYSEALDYLNPIIHLKGFYRNDLQIHARQMQIIALEQSGEADVSEALRKSLKRFIAKRAVSICGDQPILNS